MKIFVVTLHFDKGYIASPYWPELGKLIDIEKQSGMNRCRSESRIREALEQHLKKIGMSLKEYEELQVLAARPFYTTGTNGTLPSPTAPPTPALSPSSPPTIIIPRTQVYGMLVHAADTIRSAGRPCHPDQVRSLVQATDFSTGKTEPDGLWERMVLPKDGSGKPLSNQRGLRQDYFIRDFDAKGAFQLDPNYIKPDVVRELLVYAGQNIGIGASRKMGWGRFEVSGFVEVKK